MDSKSDYKIRWYYLSTLFPGQFEDKLPKGNELTELARSICSAGNFSQIELEISVLRLLVYDSFPIKWNMIKCEFGNLPGKY